MKITDEMCKVMRDNLSRWPDTDEMKEAIAAVAPLIAQEAAREIAALQRTVEATARCHVEAEAEIKAQAQEIAALKAARESDGLLDKVLAEFEKRTMGVPLGHESRSRGSSTYNWRICHLDELKQIALEVRGVIRPAKP